MTAYTYNSFLYGLLREREEMRMDAGACCVCMEMEKFSPIKIGENEQNFIKNVVNSYQHRQFS